MKKKLFCLTLLLGVVICLFYTPKTVKAAGDIAINIATFPDDNFRSYVSKNFDSDKNGLLSSSEITAVTYMRVSSDSIVDLKGIEFFTKLTYLDCDYNGLTSLDVSKNTELTMLSCDYNQLISLDVNGCTELTELYCVSNQLTSLDVSKNTELTRLVCNYNQLTSLDVSKNTKLEYLACESNQLTNLDVSGCTALEYLYCFSNQLTSLDVSKNTALTEMDCSTNQLTSLDVSKNTVLDFLKCQCNQLTSLDVSKNTALTALHCYVNQLTSLDVSKNTAMTTLFCTSNQLTSLDLRKNTALDHLYCFSNQLTSLDVSKNTKLEYLACYNNQLISLDISSCPYIAIAFNEGRVWQQTDYVQYNANESPYSQLNVDYDTVVVADYPTRIYGDNRYQTGIKIAEVLKEVLEVEKLQNIVLVSGKDFPDGLSASYLAAKLQAPILTTSANEKYYKVINEYVLNNLADDGTVYVIGGESAVPDASIKGLSNVNCIRYAGSSRYATNLEILRACSVDAGSEVLIATGKDFPDSLSVSSTGLPLFLMNGEKGTLNNDQKSYLKTLADNGCTFTIIGGTGAVSEAAEALIEELTGKEPDRIAGSNRYTTSTAIADRYFPDTNQVVLSYGKTFPDALCAGPLGAALKAPIILTASGKTAINASKGYTGSHGTRTFNGIHKGYVLGGPTLISDDDVRTILGLDESISILEK